MYKILLPERGYLQKLAKDVGVTTRTVQYALRFVSEGDQPDLIRERAIKFYGGILIKRPVKFSLKRNGHESGV